MPGNLKDFATGTVKVAPSPATTGTTLQLQTGEGARMPAVPFYATAHSPATFPTLDSAEKIQVTDVTGDTITFVRAQGGTTAQAIAIGWRISNAIFKENFDDKADKTTTYTKAEVDSLISSKEAAIALGTATQYLRGDKTWQNLDKAVVGLGNVDNTSDANKPISTATQTALDTKATTTALDAHANSTANPHNVTKAQVGLGNVDNTSDANKPVSAATQTALDGKAKKKPSLVGGVNWSDILTIAHRNAALVYPEQSLEGLQACYEDGIAIEVDVRALSDGTLVCLHDATVDRTMVDIPTGSVSSKTYTEWKTAKIKPNAQTGMYGTPATFNEVLDKFGGRIIIVPQLYDDSKVASFIDAIKSRGLERDVIAQSFTYSIAQQLAAAGIETVYLSESVPAQTPVQIKTAGINFVGGSWNNATWTTAVLNAFKAQGIKTIGYTISTRQQHLDAQAIGWESLFSDDPWLTADTNGSVGTDYSVSKHPNSKARRVRAIHNLNGAGNQDGLYIEVDRNQAGTAISNNIRTKLNVNSVGSAAYSYLQRHEVSDGGYHTINHTYPSGDMETKQVSNTGLSKNIIQALAGGSNEAQLDLMSGSASTRHFFRESDGAYGFYHMGSTKLRIMPSGIYIGEGGTSVNIGAFSTPAQRLEVTGNARINGADYITGTGFPEGVISAPVGSIYIDKVITNGASSWIKKSGTGSTGWQVLEGDTGNRDISSLMLNGWTSVSGRITMRRIGNLVNITAAIGIGIDGTAATSDVFMNIPAGFEIRRQGSHNYDVLGSGYINFGGGSASVISRRFGSIGTASRQAGFGFNLQYVTESTWPTTLPGTAA